MALFNEESDDATKIGTEIEGFLKNLMEVQRKYANEQRGAKSNRQDEVRDLVDKFAARGERNAD